MLLGFNQAYAYSLEEITITVLEYDDSTASVQLGWNDDESIKQYEIGCVSCMPNLSEFTSNDNITFNNVSPLPNTSSATMYIIAFDSDDQIIDAKQILVDLSN